MPLLCTVHTTPLDGQIQFEIRLEFELLPAQKGYSAKVKVCGYFWLFPTFLLLQYCSELKITHHIGHCEYVIYSKWQFTLNFCSEVIQGFHLQCEIEFKRSTFLQNTQSFHVNSVSGHFPSGCFQTDIPPVDQLYSM